MGARGEIDLQLWQNADDDEELWLSARHSGGDWSEYGTQEIELDRTSSSGRYRYTRLSITLSESEAVGPFEPGETAPEVCPPADLPSTEAQVWLWQRQPEQLEFRISSRPDSDTRYTTTMVNMAIQEGGGWRVGDATIGGSDGAIELRVWQDPADLDEVHLSARAAGAYWAEYGTKRINLNRESRSGRYLYTGRSLELTVPDNEGGAPAPGQTGRSWNCASPVARVALVESAAWAESAASVPPKVKAANRPPSPRPEPGARGRRRGRPVGQGRRHRYARRHGQLRPRRRRHDQLLVERPLRRQPERCDHRAAELHGDRRPGRYHADLHADRHRPGRPERLRQRRRDRQAGQPRARSRGRR